LLRNDPAFVAEEGTREVELASVELIRDDGTTERPIHASENITIQIDAKANAAVTDLIASFQVLDSANYAIVERREPIGRIDAKKRVRFTLRDVPLVPGRYFVTVGLESGESGRLYHVQTQRYWFEVAGEDHPQAPVQFRVDATVEDL
jgi:hypothetical protein